MAISPFVAQLRAHIGHDLLLLPSVAACVFGDDGRLLVALHEDGHWAPPGGAVEPDERPVEAVVREVQEEVGLDIGVRGLIGTYGGPECRVRYLNGDQVAYVITAYACEVRGGRLVPDGDEISAARFVSADEIGTLPLSPWFRLASPDIFGWPTRSETGRGGRVLGDDGPVHVSPLRVRPRYCDAQGMVHASRYYEFFEDAFLGWLDEHVGGYERLRRAGTDLVVVASGCDHGEPARLDDRLAVDVRPVRVGRTSLTMSFTIRRQETVIVTGRTTYVAVGDGTGSVPLPEPLTAALRSPRIG
ncbi:MAG: NUDIX domain-containing protein [Actinomadura sp.]